MERLAYERRNDLPVDMMLLVEKINELCEKINELEGSVRELKIKGRKDERNNRSNGPEFSAENYAHEFSL
jgi:hypothetical protein